MDAEPAFRNLLTGCLPSLLHGFAFTLLTIALGVTSRRAAWIWIVTGSLFEIAQYVFPQLGSFDPLDLIANTVGCLTVAFVSTRVKVSYNKTRRPLLISAWMVGILTSVATSGPPQHVKRESRRRVVDVSPDGMRIISGGADNSLKLWDAVSGEMLKSFAGHAGAVWSVAFSSDGRRIVSGGSDQKVKLWDASSG